MFEVNKTYKTKDGRDVTIVQEKYAGTDYACVEGNDGIWRYNRPSDMGRTTASAFDMSCPTNLMTETKNDDDLSE